MGEARQWFEGNVIVCIHMSVVQLQCLIPEDIKESCMLHSLFP